MANRIVIVVAMTTYLYTHCVHLNHKYTSNHNDFYNVIKYTSIYNDFYNVIKYTSIHNDFYNVIKYTSIHNDFITL